MLSPELLSPNTTCKQGDHVSVLGEVTRPGSFPCAPGMRLTDAIIAAGGLTVLAWRNDTRLQRGKAMYRVPLQNILDGTTPDPVLAADDYILVPDRT